MIYKKRRNKFMIYFHYEAFLIMNKNYVSQHTAVINEN